MTGPMIEVAGVTKRFGGNLALDRVDLEVDAGTVVGLLGPNGAGKTTLVRILATLLRADAGSAQVAGFDVRRDAVSLRRVIGLAGQYAAVDEMLTGRENLELVGRLYHLDKAERRRRAAETLDWLSLLDAADRQVRTYSGGMRRRLDLGASLVGRPQVLMLDEPTTGLDPATRIDLWRFIETLVGEGATVLLTTQYLEEADRLANRIAVIDHGRVIAEGTSNELKAKLGGAVLEVVVADERLLERAAGLLSGAGHAEPGVDRARSMVTVSCDADVTVLLDAARRLDEHGVGVEDIALRRPSLDDVFLTLTGHGAGDADGGTAGAREAGTAGAAEGGP